MSRRIRALLVEDNFLAQMVAQLIITDAGCNVDLSRSGREAVELACQNKYDIIFMDIGLDDMDGFEVAQNIRQKSIINLTTPIVALTAHSGDDYKVLSERSGMVGFITKPLSLDTIQGILDRYLNNPKTTIDS